MQDVSEHSRPVGKADFLGIRKQRPKHSHTSGPDSAPIELLLTAEFPVSALNRIPLVKTTLLLFDEHGSFVKQQDACDVMD